MKVSLIILFLTFAVFLESTRGFVKFNPVCRGFTKFMLVLIRSDLQGATVRFTNIECSKEGKYTKNNVCKFRAINRKSYLVNVYLDVIDKIKSGFVNIIFSRSNSMNQFYAYINVTESYCSDSGKTFIQSMKGMFDVLQRNLLPKCPIQVPI